VTARRTERDGRQADEWDVVSRRVTLCGRVIGKDGRPHEGGRVVVQPPDAGGGAPEACRRPGGLYYVLDLPPGSYRVIATDAGGRPLAEGKASVPRSASGAARPVVVDLAM
jgi:hypothetical protein